MQALQDDTWVALNLLKTTICSRSIVFGMFVASIELFLMFLNDDETRNVDCTNSSLASISCQDSGFECFQTTMVVFIWQRS